MEKEGRGNRLTIHVESAFTGTLSFACCTVLGLGAALAPPRVESHAPPKTVEKTPMAIYSFLTARARI